MAENVPAYFINGEKLILEGVEGSNTINAIKVTAANQLGCFAPEIMVMDLKSGINLEDGIWDLGQTIPEACTGIQIINDTMVERTNSFWIKTLDCHVQEDDIDGVHRALEAMRVPGTDRLLIENCLAYAVQRQHTRVIQAVLEHTPDDMMNIDTAVNGLGLTMLMVASEGGYDTAVAQLLDANADTSKRDRWGRTPLYYAAWNGHSLVVQHLIAAGADINQIGGNGEPPLHVATRCGFKDIVQLLLDGKADITLRQTTGNKQTALELAKKYVKAREVIPLLEQKAYEQIINKHHVESDNNTIEI